MISLVTKGLPSRSPPIQAPNWKNGGTSNVHPDSPAQCTSSFSSNAGNGIEQGLIEEMQAPGYLLRDGGLLQPQLAGEPEQFDFAASFWMSSVRSRRVQRGDSRSMSAAIDAAMTLEHRDPLGLGGMRRDDRPDPQFGQQAADLISLDPDGCRVARSAARRCRARPDSRAGSRPRAAGASRHSAPRCSAAGTRCPAPAACARAAAASGLQRSISPRSSGTISGS